MNRPCSGGPYRHDAEQAVLRGMLKVPCIMAHLWHRGGKMFSSDQALAHFPSGRFTANAAWTVIAALAHNLLRWTQSIGVPGQTVRAARTLRRRLLSMPGRLTRTARTWTLHLPARWPWHENFTQALEQIRALPPPA